MYWKKYFKDRMELTIWYVVKQLNTHIYSHWLFGTIKWKCFIVALVITKEVYMYYINLFLKYLFYNDFYLNIKLLANISASNAFHTWIWFWIILKSTKYMYICNGCINFLSDNFVIRRLFLNEMGRCNTVTNL